ncbi:MAG: type I restriction enzyme HsdR N-terminal domain-containing protein [Opitutaceae bacterium]|nr:type I restriction enzyme HsdR N-terminal domain-containing protein [Cytophagales bacterium]
MDFKDQIKQLASRVEKMLPQINTEEATKTSLVMPFIQILGYDVFNPFEVNPEFIADIGIKKGEKVDYAIMKDNNPMILIECKHYKEKLDPHQSQLFRYFHTTKAKFGLLTNGLCYKFYTDLVEPNKMDENPFFEFVLTEVKDTELIELQKFSKSYFDVDSIVNTASELKYSNAIKKILHTEFKSPTTNFVKYFVTQVYDGKATEKVMVQFTEIVKKSVNQFASDIISERLKTALDQEAAIDKAEAIIAANELSTVPKDPGFETTTEETEGFLIIKSILRQKFAVNRIVGRDTKSYFGILLDDNNRKPLARLLFNGGKKYIILFGKDKVETKLELTDIDSIYSYADQLLKSVAHYEEV